MTKGDEARKTPTKNLLPLNVPCHQQFMKLGLLGIIDKIPVHFSNFLFDQFKDVILKLECDLRANIEECTERKLKFSHPTIINRNFVDYSQIFGRLKSVNPLCTNSSF